MSLLKSNRINNRGVCILWHVSLHLKKSYNVSLVGLLLDVCIYYAQKVKC